MLRSSHRHSSSILNPSSHPLERHDALIILGLDALILIAILVISQRSVLKGAPQR